KACPEHANILRINGEEVSIVTVDVRDLKFTSEIGYGDNGHVSKYTFKGTLMAVKEMIPPRGRRDNMKQYITDLVEISKTSDCPNIVHIFGCLMTEEKVMVCMEVAAICLDRVLRRTENAPVPEEIIGKIAMSVLSTLEYLMDKHNLTHWSVRPSNILIDWNGTVRLCDIGVSSRLFDQKVRSRMGHTIPYMAPERLDPNASPDHDIRSYVWSLGIIMVELARGKYPYAHLRSEFDIFSEIMKGEPPVIKYDEGFSEEFVDFVSLMLQKEIDRRPTYKTLLKHPVIVRSKSEDTDVADWLANIMQMDD
ncbi:hypothetical protein PMAYCL1PPCAC_13584, partial [Pristionchus mayeri]